MLRRCFGRFWNRHQLQCDCLSEFSFPNSCQPPVPQIAYYEPHFLPCMEVTAIDVSLLYRHQHNDPQKVCTMLVAIMSSGAAAQAGIASVCTVIQSCYKCSIPARVNLLTSAQQWKSVCKNTTNSSLLFLV